MNGCDCFYYYVAFESAGITVPSVCCLIIHGAMATKVFSNACDIDSSTVLVPPVLKQYCSIFFFSRPPSLLAI